GVWRGARCSQQNAFDLVNDPRNSRPRTTEPPRDVRIVADVFDAFPYGILVVDKTGTIVASNPAAAEILGDAAGLDGRPARSCDILGCRRSGPREVICLTDMGLE